MSEKCRSCGAPIEWAITSGGRRMPVDTQPTETGTYLLSHRAFGKAPTAIYQNKEAIDILRAQAIAIGQPFRLFTSHFATCPQASKWRKK